MLWLVVLVWEVLVLVAIVMVLVHFMLMEKINMDHVFQKEASVDVLGEVIMPLPVEGCKMLKAVNDYFIRDRLSFIIIYCYLKFVILNSNVVKTLKK
jgi:hypothetical protein